MELILSQPNLLDDNDDDSDQENESNNDSFLVNPSKTSEYSMVFYPFQELNRAPLFSLNGPFISFRKFRQQRFQPNVKVNHFSSELSP